MTRSTTDGDSDALRGELPARDPAGHDPAGRAPAPEVRAAPETRDIPRVERSAIALSLLFAYGVLAAVVAAMPLTEVTRVFYGGHPHGDAPLAEPGGLALADLLLGRGASAFSAALPTSFVLVVLGAVGAHLPFGALIAHLSMQGGIPRGTLRQAYARSASRFFVLGSATVVSMAARAVVVVAAVALASLVSQSTQPKLSDRASDLVGLAVLLPFALLVLFVFVLTDLAYVAIVADGASLPRALLHAVRTLRSEGRRALFPALLAYTGGLATTAVAASSVGFLAIAASPALLFLTHQAALLTKTILRAAWLARAISFPPPHAPSLAAVAPAQADESDDARLEGRSPIEASSSRAHASPSAPGPASAPSESASVAVPSTSADDGRAR